MSPDDSASTNIVVTIVTGVIGIMGGGFGIGLLNQWKDRTRAQASLEVGRSKTLATNEANAREWLTEQLEERAREVESIRLRELNMLSELGDVKASVARLEEQLRGAMIQVDMLKDQAQKWGTDFDDMKKERDYYRDKKHDSDTRLTSESLRAQLSERNLVEAHKEIDRLKGQVETLTGRFPVVVVEDKP